MKGRCLSRWGLLLLLLLLFVVVVVLVVVVVVVAALLLLLLLLRRRRRRHRRRHRTPRQGGMGSAVLWLLAFPGESNPNFLCIALGKESDLI